MTPWWRREIPLPRLSTAGRALAIGAAALSLAGALAAGIDATVWYLGAPGLLVARFGRAFLRRHLRPKALSSFQVFLLALWLTTTFRWSFTDELALAFWGMVMGGYLFYRFYRR